MNIQQKIESLENILLYMNDLDSQQLIQHCLNINEQFETLNSNQMVKNVCQAELKKGQLAYQCFDCSSETSHLYCSECFQTEKHKNHLAVYIYSDGGACDCGNEFLIKKESFCDKHQFNKIKITQGNEIIRVQYREFVQVSFALLINKIEQIVDYPYQFKEKIQNALQYINDSQQNKQSDKLAKFQQLEQDIQKLYELIVKVLKTIIEGNFSLSHLTSEFLQQPLDQDIQNLIQLHHNHTKTEIKISQLKEQCNCSILELFIKFNGFLCQIIPNNKPQLTTVFDFLQIDDTFYRFFCQLIQQNYSLLFFPIKKYKFSTPQGSFKIIMNSLNYSNQYEFLETFEKIKKNRNISQIKVKNCLLFQQEIFQKFYNIKGSAKFDSIQKQDSFKFYKILQKTMPKIPLCNKSSMLFSISCVYSFFEWANENVQINYLEQILQIIRNEDSRFLLQIMNPSEPIFRKLQKHSLLIYILTKACPLCTSTSTEYNFLNQKKSQKYTIYALRTQLFCMSVFRIFFQNLVENWIDLNIIGLINILRVILNYFFRHLQNHFEFYTDPLKCWLTNSVIGDRNFIIVLSNYISIFSDPQDAYKDLLEVHGEGPVQFKNKMLSILKRTLLNQYTLLNNEYYTQSQPAFVVPLKFGEVAPELVDLAFIQIYAFIFGSNGINDIINQFQIIGSVFHSSRSTASLICRLSQSEYDMILCQDADIEKIANGFSKLFKTYFFAQKSYNPNDLVKKLKLFHFGYFLDIQKFILSSCELHKDNCLYLKKHFWPPQYEPVYTQNTSFLNEQIKDKLTKEGDYFVLLFGNAFASELKTQTINQKRLAILKAIIKDEKQIILKEIIQNLQTNLQNYNFIVTLLQQNALYINLLFQINKVFGPNKVIIEDLQSLLRICHEIVKRNNIHSLSSVFCNYILLLDNSFIIDLKFHDYQEYYHQTQLLKKQYIKNKIQYLNNIQSQVQEGNQIKDDFCSLCQLTFNENDLKYQPVLMQFKNIHKYYPLFSFEINCPFDIYQIDISWCGHLFHSKCLKENKNDSFFGSQSYHKCPVCSYYYTFAFLDLINLTTFKNEQLLEDIENYLQTIPEDIYLQYINKYTIDNKYQLSLVVFELFNCALCNLIIKLLNNTKDFYQNQYYLLLQQVIHILRLVYKENQQSLNFFNDEILFGLLNAIQNFLIASNSLNEFELYLKQVFDEKYRNIYDLITKQKIEDQNIRSLQIYNQQFKKIKTHLLEFFPGDFKQFLVKYNLIPCDRKKCKSRPHYKQEYFEQEQCYCLICLKKMCIAYCNQPTNIHGNIASPLKQIYLHRDKQLKNQIFCTSL